MPEFHSSDISGITSSLDHTTGYQSLQVQDALDLSCDSGSLNTSQITNPQQLANRSSGEQIRLSLLRTNNALCIILVVGALIASTIAFCITKSPLSFGLLSFLSLVTSLRHRLDESAFPISHEDHQTRRKELDVEIARIKQQSTIASLPLFSWLRHLFRKVGK